MLVADLRKYCDVSSAADSDVIVKVFELLNFVSNGC